MQKHCVNNLQSSFPRNKFGLLSEHRKCEKFIKLLNERIIILCERMNKSVAFGPLNVTDDSYEVKTLKQNFKSESLL